MRQFVTFSFLFLFCITLSAATSYHWSRMPGNYGGEIYCMTADKHGTIYAGSKAIFSSTDEGETWTKFCDNFSPDFVTNLIVTDSVILADFMEDYCDYFEHFTRISRDKGATWYVDSLFDDNHPIRNKLLTFNNFKYIWSKYHILKSIDNGKSWIRIDTGYISDLIMDKKGCLLYSLSNSYINKYDPITDKIYELTFDSSNINKHSGKFCIDSSNIYYLGLYESKNDNLLISKDEGKTWVGAVFHNSISNMSAGNGDSIFIFSKDNKVLLSTNYGQNWIETIKLKNVFDKFYFSQTGNLFIYGNSILKHSKGEWKNKVEGIDAMTITSVSEQKDKLYCSCLSDGINYFNKSQQKWISYFNPSGYFNIDNFIVSGNNFITADYCNVYVSDIDSINWLAKQGSPIYSDWFICDHIMYPKLQTRKDLVCFSCYNLTYISTNNGYVWNDVSLPFDSSYITSNFVDKNGYVFITKNDYSGAADSIKGPVLYSKDNGKSWLKPNFNFNRSNNILLAGDYNNNLIAIEDSIFYRYNLINNSFDSIYKYHQWLYGGVFFINENQFLTFSKKYNYWSPSNSVIIFDIFSNEIDTISIDYPYIEIYRVFRASDGGVYAATDRGVFKLDITTDVEEVGNNGDTKFRIYPNPANETVTISFKNIGQNLLSLKIINQIGVIVFENNLNKMSALNLIQINIKEYAPGIYMCILKTRDESFIQKFVVIK
jgi:hypothetical protein